MAKRRKGLSAEDAALWDRVKNSATPLARKTATRAADTPAKPPLPMPDPPAETKAKPIKPFRMGEASGGRSHPSHPHQTPTGPPSIPHGPVRVRQGEHRRMQRGKLKPEARIDLHGMTLAAAHPALMGFVMDGYDRGLRLLLVITGKGQGGPGQDDGPIPVRRGVLRQQVPGWLTAPPLGAIVLDVRPAHQRHGGEGAYYVYLKRRR